MIEARGFATTVVGLVRLHLEKSMVPRSLFVPFQLGRPLGEPGDAGFQRRVLTQALALLERRDGPVIIEDFADDPPGWADTPGWRSRMDIERPALPPSRDVAAWSAALTAEIARVRPHYEAAVAGYGRTSVGISQQPPESWPNYAADFLAGGLPTPPDGLPSSAVALRFLADDLKAFYGEAVQAEGPFPSSRQLDRWFWSETVAGALLQELRRVGMASDNNALKTVAGRFFVPGPHVRA
jgi:hypothetical protein